ncbi:hypothetical protein LZ318_12060 [Saccharopolyspora indica]|uniref:hypothetical protein n=1 Tax=Saccharopolyspora indica TaxID=1229659 RepID=UPI0022EA76DA|nr:hypothetical protein [Saccharopolyspora indica]MDA3643757.1 hypothetical protein [Saccharopolyspora indica]
MEAQLYHQRPIPLRWLSPACAVLALGYAALPVVMALAPGTTRASVLRSNPELTGTAVDFAVAAAIAYSGVVHAISIALLIWFTAATLRGRRWGRIALTVLLVLATAGSFASWDAGLQFQWSVILNNALHLVVLGLVWAPRSARRYFTAPG